MHRPLRADVQVKKESRKPSLSIDDLYSDDDDCVLSSPPPKRFAKSTALRQPQGVGIESFWRTEDAESVSLIVLRNPNVKCTIKAETHDTLTIEWVTTVPPDDVLSLIGGA